LSHDKCVYCLWTVVQNEDDSDEDLESDDDEVAAIRAQQTAAQFGWFDDLFVFNTGKFLMLLHSACAVILYIRWAMHKLGVEEWLASAVVSVYTGAETVVTVMVLRWDVGMVICLG